MGRKIEPTSNTTWQPALTTLTPKTFVYKQIKQIYLFSLMGQFHSNGL